MSKLPGQVGASVISGRVQMQKPEQLILASASPRRHELLRQLGICFRVVVSDADESGLEGELPADYVCRVATNKVKAVANRDVSGLPILGADTAVVIGGQILGKPGSKQEAANMLRMLSGQVHEVFSAVVLADADRRLSSRLNITRVHFTELDDDWISAYVATGEPMDKAGAYGVQGCAAHRIHEINGSYSGVMGLPLYETMELLRGAGFRLSPCVELVGVCE